MPGECGRCGLYVGAAEERLALDKSWHLECFTCAICNKGLDSLTLAEYRELNEIYCISCYRQFIGLQGYGYGPNGPTLIIYDVPDEFQEHPGTDETPRQWEQPPTRLGKIFRRTRVVPPHYTHASGGTGQGQGQGQGQGEVYIEETNNRRSKSLSQGSPKIVQESRVSQNSSPMSLKQSKTSIGLLETNSPEEKEVEVEEVASASSPIAKSKWSFRTPPPPVPKTSLLPTKKSSSGSGSISPIEPIPLSNSGDIIQPPPLPPPFPTTNNSTSREKIRTPTTTATPILSRSNTSPPSPPPLPAPLSKAVSSNRVNSGPLTPTVSTGSRNSKSLEPLPSPPNVSKIGSRGDSGPLTPTRSPGSNRSIVLPPAPSPPSSSSPIGSSNSLPKATSRVPSNPIKSNSKSPSEGGSYENSVALTLNTNTARTMHRTSGNMLITPRSGSGSGQGSGLATDNDDTEVIETGEDCPPLFFCGGKCVGTPSSPRYPPGPPDGRRIPLGPNYGAVRTVPKGVGEPCRRCGRPVFHTELQLGYHGAYHIECFKCCACEKKLDSTSVAEHQGELYCKGCYRRNFGLHGVGFGVGAGTLQTP